MSDRTRLKNLPLDDASRGILALDEPRFRAQQVLGWVYRKRVSSFDEMRNVSKQTRAKLAERFTIDKLECPVRLVSSAGDAVKFGFRLVESDELVESVLLIDRKRRTACLSSQLGCGLGCTFCATGAMGFVRNLAQDEVVGQLIGINDYLAEQDDKPLTHVVFMGMGEALSNFDVFKSTCEIITAEVGFGLADRRITVSTAGVVPSIDRLIREGPPVNLAISLNTYSDELRSRTMPVNRTYPIAEVVAAGRRFVSATGRTLTFEYVVVEGENDTPGAVDALSRLLRGIPCKVNCIPLNPTSTGEGKSPPYERILQFVQALHERGITATARRSRGRDIDGACGQLSTGAKRRDRQ
ncbi:MAG: 23S rRNA (adenine(2503)-C(2))-methyltransferase RlmN [Chitinivibrionales bacterium]|nr:23S rRNA (adenine(2503)-C(2))-methyltransferase RlmN [Chitinivibrionales bacterium]